jgi:hypothetical protein
MPAVASWANRGGEESANIARRPVHDSEWETDFEQDHAQTDTALPDRTMHHEVAW